MLSAIGAVVKVLILMLVWYLMFGLFACAVNQNNLNNEVNPSMFVL